MKSVYCAECGVNNFSISDKFVMTLVVGGWGQQQQLWGENMQDLGICKGEEEGRDPCEGFSMAELSFDNYEDIFSCTQGMSSASFDDIQAEEAGCAVSMGQDSVDVKPHDQHVQSIPDSELLEATTNVIISLSLSLSLSHHMVFLSNFCFCIFFIADNIISFT
jgi:hypothetical protein